jgi:hypothetical protein
MPKTLCGEQISKQQGPLVILGAEVQAGRGEKAAIGLCLLSERPKGLKASPVPRSVHGNQSCAGVYNFSHFCGVDPFQ